ncbi:ACT domain-containing protein [Jiangella aurantiaca]|uniref:ACT domain-containing protein n=1 Tax=Jiangella aurantiaca TaxID=2530373 RepID=A0A4R5AEP5_9ACTN|nr:ACT domain-containing protein [Jiangella aurantiaca]TDD71008.1 ACT domain-containing protein [Jiangella aurantiaca]
MSLIAVTVIGHDRPGIIADATAGLAGLGLNLEDSTMTLLRGHFAMMLICSGDRSPAEVEDALAPLTADGRLQVSARAVPDEDAVDVLGRRPYVLTVHGGDRPGIVSAVTRVLAAAGGNITDLTTRLTGDLYVAVAEVDLPADADADAVAMRLRDAGTELGVGVTLRPQETDVL